MPWVSTARAMLAVIVFACAAGAVHAQPAAPQLAPVAHSALLAVDAGPAADGLVLRVRRASGETPLVVSDLAVTIDGKSEPATARTDGNWFVSRPPGVKDAGKTIEVTIGHDGIHEVLSGSLAAPAAGAARGAAPTGATNVTGSSHKQFYWWILNIAIVLIAVIAISRRTS
jgi:hypothetical protein